MKVTIIGLHYLPETTGNAPYTSSLAEGLTSLGHETLVITGYPHYPEWKVRPGFSGWSRREIINAVVTKRLRHYVPTNPTALKRLHMELSFGVRVLFARWNDPDVVVLVSPALFSTAFAVLRARFGYRRPATVVWVQDLYSRGIIETAGANGLTARLAAGFESQIFRWCEGVIAIHDRFQSYLVTTLRLDEGRTRVIRNWTHLAPLPPVDVLKTREKLGWKPEDIVVLHAGNMGKKQGLDNVVNAARLASASNSRVRFVLMGNGNQRPALELAGAGIERLEFVDSLPGDEFQHALKAADVLLVNELAGVRDMAVPSKLTSYFTAGVPVLAATDAASVTASEIEASGGGVRVDAADPSALLNAAERLGTDKDLSKLLGKQGKRFRDEILSETTAIGHYNEFITSLATSRDR